MIDKILNVLILEDVKTDEALIKHQLFKAAPNSLVTVIRDRVSFQEKISWPAPDLVLADYKLPDMNGLEALLHIRDNMPKVPFIFVTGELKDDEAVASAILQGASGYVLKKNLAQLPEVILEIIKKTDAANKESKEKERRRQEARLALQKSIALLDKAPHFTERQEIQELLKKVLDANVPHLGQ